MEANELFAARITLLGATLELLNGVVFDDEESYKEYLDLMIESGYSLEFIENAPTITVIQKIAKDVAETDISKFMEVDSIESG